MNATMTSARLPALEMQVEAQPTRGLVAAMTQWIAGLGVDARTRYLSESSDPVDCEQRLREWAEYERRSAMFRLLP